MRVLSAVMLALLVACASPRASSDLAPPDLDLSDPRADLPDASVSIVARDLQGAALAGATVQVGEASARTDLAGEALLEGLTVGLHAWTVQAEGHAVTGGTVRVLPDAPADVSAWLAPLVSDSLPSTGGSVGRDGVRIAFPDGAWTAENVDVAWTVLTSPADRAAIPGGGRGVDAEGLPITVQPLAALDVRLTADGQALAMDMPARLILDGFATSPLLEGFATSPLLEGFAISPLGLQLMHYDEPAGIWRPEGTLELNDGALEADLPHFSWWTVAATFSDTVCAGGTLLGPHGDPAAGLEVEVGWGGGWGRGRSGSDGSFCVDVPAGAALTLRAATALGVANATAEAPAGCATPSCDVFGEVRLVPVTDPDADGDGAMIGADVPPGAADCDDSDPGIAPGQDELCDGVDEDCDGWIDNDASDAPKWYLDGDGDGWGEAAAMVTSCTPVVGHAPYSSDCDDGDPDRFPTAEERCDEVDNDCDGDVDDHPVDGSTWWPDADADGYGVDTLATGGAAGVSACNPVPGHSTMAGDCDDTSADTHPDADERCNGVDDDCDGEADDDAVDGDDWYPDQDGDGHGNWTMLPRRRCSPLSGHVVLADDCNDFMFQMHPGAEEICDGVDNDCNFFVDDAPTDGVSTWPDLDGDGYGDASAQPVATCAVQADASLNGADCDDDDVTRHPAAPEVCDLVDNDCNGIVDVDDTVDDAGTVAWSTCDAACAVVAGDTSWFAWCDQPVAFDTAAVRCAEMGMVRAMPVSEIDHDAVMDLLQGESWLGASDAAVEGDWVWDDGSPVTLPGESVPGEPARWAVAQPDDEASGEHCMTLLFDGTWVDRDCGLPQAFVCEAPR